ncbi:MAG: PocR ligand-binding domain-containing protein, partial [Deltaproteobacteria bacterium]|nr:PocR ligand-binding domain-containing protein [Deltaproteobacteria bacterium]
FLGGVSIFEDITERKRAEEALEKRLIALSRPLDDPEAIDFDELFNMEDIQHLQDLFAKATGVASIITNPDGTPITKPSNFCRLCIDIIRQTELGIKNCYCSDATIGRHHPEGPIVQPCLSGGLWDAGASITVGGKHIANWLIGQVRNEAQTEENMREYARKIGANEEEFIEAFYEVTTMPESQFKQVADALFALANQLSAIAYQNVQQARFITERKKAEEERKKLAAQLIQAQKMEAIGTLAGGIAHDFNNILTAIIGYTELVQDELEEGTPISNYQQEVLKAAERARDLVKQILAFSRQDKQELKPIQITPIIKDTLKFLRSSLPTTIDIRGHLASDTGIVLANPTQIHQVLMNLGTNAAHAMREKGGILGVGLEKIDLQADNLGRYPHLSFGPYLRLTVSDTGHGMDQEMVARIFEPFFTTKNQGEGTGMGLAVVHGIIKSYGGEIKVYSEPGKGTTFQVLLPSFRWRSRIGQHAQNFNHR